MTKYVIIGYNQLKLMHELIRDYHTLNRCNSKKELSLFNLGTYVIRDLEDKLKHGKTKVSR